jgi:nitrogen fixation-related uncharacterized protein
MLQTRPEDRPSADDAQWMIVQNTSRYQVAARELKVLYNRIIGKPRSGFTELLELHKDDASVPAALFNQPYSRPIVVEAEARVLAQRLIDSHSQVTHPDAPAQLRRSSAAEPLGEYATGDHTNTGAAVSWSSEPVCEPTLRLPAFEASIGAELVATLPSGSAPDATTEPSPPEPVPAPRRLPNYLIAVAACLALLSGTLFFWSLTNAFGDDEEPAPGAAKHDSEATKDSEAIKLAAKAAPEQVTPVETPTPELEPPKPELEPPTPDPLPPALEPAAPETTPPPPLPEPEVKPKPAAKPSPKPTPKPAAKPSVEVTFVISGASTAYLEIGARKLDYRSFAMTKLKPGKYSVRWRKSATEAWQVAGTLRIEDDLAPGTFYDVKLTSTTLTATKGAKGSAK